MYYSMKQRKRKKPRTSTVLLFSLVLFIFGIYLISYNYLVAKKEKIYSSMNLLLYEDETPKTIEKEDTVNPTTVEENVPERLANIGEEDKSISYSYIGTLEVPAVNIKRGFLNIESPYNNVNRNVTVIEHSTFPDVDKGNLILAAHSGNCWVCYFDKLYKLSIDDKSIVTYNGYKYTYTLKTVYNVAKTGQVEIKRDPSKTVLTLITCTHNSDTEQTVYIFELVNKTKK